MVIKSLNKKIFLLVLLFVYGFGFAVKAHADITTGLIGLYTFDEGSGTTASDTSGGGHTGTLTNGPIWITGHIGAGALSFDGVDDLVSTESDFIGTTAGTYSVWVYAKSEGENSLGFIITNGGATQFGLGLCSARSPGLTSNNSANNACSDVTSIAYNTWYLVTVTRNISGTANLYINGVLSGTANQNSGTPQSGTTNVMIGNSAFASRTWDGYIDDVRIYNRELSASDVLQLYNSSDTTPPIISSVASSTTGTTATITWTTDENATSTVEYGPTSSYGNVSTSASSVMLHSITLTGLTSSTLYHFRVSSGDPFNNYVTSSDYTFTTATSDVTAPIISSIASSTTATTATITWTTNESATSTVNFGATTSYGTASSSSSFVTSHSLTLPNLTPSTSYHFQISSGDSSNNYAISSDYTFTTAYPNPHYIRAGATGNNDGSSWANAWSSFSAATWTRGDIYYVAGGTYTEDVTISKAEAGTALIIVKKANATDNSSDAGWNSAYATTQAVINGNVTISNSYITINGVTGSSTSGHGIKIFQNTGSGGNAIVNFESGKSFLDISHIELEGPGMGYVNGVSGFKQNTISGTSKGIHLSNLYFHDLSQNGFVFVNTAGSSFSDYGVLFENNVLENNGYNLAGAHGQGIQCGSGAGATTQSYWIIKNSIIHNNVGTGDIACLGFSTNDYMLIYNNIFYNVNQSFDSNGNWIDYLTLNDASSPGVLYFSDTNQSADNVKVYNNTFYNIVRNTIYFGGTSTNNEVVNNLFMSGYFNQVHYGVTGNYNDYYNNAPIISSGIYGVPYGEIGQQGESLSPVVDAVGGDFRLVSSANAIGNGHNLSSVFTTDFAGNTRTTWDIGAYQYIASSIKAITVFNFSSPAVTGIVNEGAKTVALTVPYGTAITALVPTITITGASVSPSSGVAQNFTNPVTYTVTAADSSTQVYVVTVTVAADTTPAPVISSGGGGNGPIYGSTRNIPNLLYTVTPTISTTTVKITQPKYTFSRNLFIHTTGQDVKNLQKFLNSIGFIIAKSGAGSPGKETTFFGTLTYKALQKFQKLIGLPATGYFGPMTREYLRTH